jgi:hypothetical protein
MWLKPDGPSASVEQREQVIATGSGQQATGGVAVLMRRRELYESISSRTVVRPVNAGVFSRRQTCRGRRQEAGAP